MKKAIMIAALIGTMTTLAACRERHAPLKVGTMPVAMEIAE